MNKALLIAVLLIALPAFAVDVYRLQDPEKQKTYEALTSQLRCLVCQNQTIADSHAELAGDLRRQVYEMLQQGKSQDDIIQFMTARYGDFVLYNPPFKAKTGLLWVGPFAFLLIGLVMIVWIIYRKAKTQQAALDPAQKQKIRELLEHEDQS